MLKKPVKKQRYTVSGGCSRRSVVIAIDEHITCNCSRCKGRHEALPKLESGEVDCAQGNEVNTKYMYLRLGRALDSVFNLESSISVSACHLL